MSLQILIVSIVALLCFGLYTLFLGYKQAHENYFWGGFLLHMILILAYIVPVDDNFSDYQQHLFFFPLLLINIQPALFFIAVKKTLRVDFPKKRLVFLLFIPALLELILKAMALSNIVFTPEVTRFIIISIYIITLIVLTVLSVFDLGIYIQNYKDIYSFKLSEKVIITSRLLALVSIHIGIVILSVMYKEIFSVSVVLFLATFLEICLYTVLCYFVYMLMYSDENIQLQSTISTIDQNDAQDLEDELNVSKEAFNLDHDFRITDFSDNITKNFDLNLDHLKMASLIQLSWFKSDRPSIREWKKNTKIGALIKMDLRILNNDNKEAIASIFIKRIEISSNQSPFIVYIDNLYHLQWFELEKHPIHKSLFRVFNTIINNKELYKKNKLSINEAAASINLSPALLSMAMRIYSNCDFRDYMNNIRVLKAKYNLKKGKINRNNLLKFAQDHGFENEEEMQNAFNKFTNSSFDIYYKMYGKIKIPENKLNRSPIINENDVHHNVNYPHAKDVLGFGLH